MIAMRREFRGFAPDSTNISRVCWFDDGDDQGRLAVQFKSGATYLYEAVPLEVYLQLRDAESVGSTFDRLVKKAGYKFAKEEPEA